MSKDDYPRLNSTVPPPDGEADLYSASTVVGPASDELLALVRNAQEEAAASAPRAAAPNKEPAPAPATAAPQVVTAAAAEPARSTPTLPPETTRRRASKTEELPRPAVSRGLSPVVSVVLVFAAAALALAAIVR